MENKACLQIANLKLKKKNHFKRKSIKADEFNENDERMNENSIIIHFDNIKTHYIENVKKAGIKCEH
jgi:hypothetical protein